MATMMPQTMIAVASAGGGLDINYATTPVMPQTMLDIAKAAAQSGKKPTIIFRNLPMITPQVAVEVATAGEGCVIFAF